MPHFHMLKLVEDFFNPTSPISYAHPHMKSWEFYLKRHTEQGFVLFTSYQLFRVHSWDIINSTFLLLYSLATPVKGRVFLPSVLHSGSI